MAYFFKKGKLSPAYEDPVYLSGDLKKNSRSLDEDRFLKRTRLKFVIIITAIVMGIEVVGGFLTNSLALLSDAGHMLTHLFALGMSFFAIVLAARPVTKEKTYGFYRAEVLVAFVNGIALLFIAAFIFYKAIFRVFSPQSVAGLEMLLVAILGLAANGAGIFLLSGLGREDINVRSAFLHLIGDTASSCAVVLGGLIIYYTGNFIIDPLIRTQFIPNKVMILRPTEQESPDSDHLAEFTKHHLSIEGKATAYVCLNYNCRLPTTDVNKMLELLNVSKKDQKMIKSGK
ncbi:unnamed protein product [marine sediment metagenome]|uniref:Cation efflux protein transmembrane domain-containing protein n=1 Tax=marine sediment metagenome TaxID=412755 RepID=X1K088_9ZZZZ